MLSRPIARLTLHGIFRLEDAQGQPIHVTSKKARALLAMLALSRGGIRARVWLQDTLWSRCEKIEAQNSLRRELSSLRALLGNGLSDLLSIDRETVGLRLDRCHVDALQRPDDRSNMGLLLEGLDIPGEPEFEEWLRCERSASQAHPGTRIVASPAAPSGPADERLVVSIAMEVWHNGALGAMILPELFRQALITGLENTGCFRIVMATNGVLAVRDEHDAPDMEISIKAENGSTSLAIAVICVSSNDRSVVTAINTRLATNGAALSVERDLLDFSANLVERLLHRNVLNPDRKDDVHRARKKLVLATNQMFSLDPAEVRASRDTLTEVNTLSDQAVFRAWRAYQAVFLHDRAHAYDYSLTIDECKDDMRRALDRDPYNGLVLSLCAHVHAFLFRDFATAAEHLSRAEQTGTHNVMFFDTASMLNFYTGRYEEARNAAQRAEALGRALPFRYCFATSLCMIETVQGNFEAAVHAGQRAIALEPINRKRSYPPTLRYLGAALAHLGRDTEARQIFSRLSETDPASTSSTIRSRLAPLPNPSSVDLIGTALAKVGL